MRRVLASIALTTALLLVPGVAQAQTPSPTPTPTVSSGPRDLPNLGLEQFPHITCNSCSGGPLSHHPVSKPVVHHHATLARTGTATPVAGAFGGAFLLVGLALRRIFA